MKTVTRIFFLIMILSVGGRDAQALPEIMTDYQDSPFFMSSNVLPNIMILADNSGSMNELAYMKGLYDATVTYSGYFSPTLHYSYDNVTDPANPKWVINDPIGAPPDGDWANIWLGSFLNWATMRKIDIARKVLVGGLAVSRPSVGGLQTIKAHQPVAADYASTQTHADLTASMPWDNTSPYVPHLGWWGKTYSYAVKDDFIGSGTGFKVNITSIGAGGAVTGVAPNAGGTLYRVGEVLTISGGGNNATVTIDSVDWTWWGGAGQAVLSFHITSGGTGYVVAAGKTTAYSGAKCPTMMVTQKDTISGTGCKLDLAVSGSGATVNVTAVLSGKVTGVTLNTGGSGYLAGDSLTITAGSNTATVTVATVNALGAVLTLGAITVPGTLYAVAANKATTCKGPVSSIVLNAGGANYNPGDILSITGGGGLSATAVVDTVNATGAVTGVHPTAGGTGYSNTTAAVTASGAVTWTRKYCVYVQKDTTKEPFEFVSSDVAGIIQKISTKARFGLTFFEANAIGGKVVEPIGLTTAAGYSSTFITNYEIGSTPKTSTPLAETLWEIMGYFKQNTAMRQDATYYPVNADHTGDAFWYSDAAKLVECGKNYVMIITDGEPTDDDFSDITAASKPAGAAATLDAIALTAHTTDLRGDITSPPNQNLGIYTIYLFGDASSAGNTARTLLNNTAKNGAFIDSNGSNTPDLLTEWHTTTATLNNVNAGGPPYVPVSPAIPQADTFFAANDADQMESQIMAAFTDILKRASSGTAISVLATSASGAGDIFQAYFLPSKTIIDALGSRDLTWTGHLLSLKVDSKGSLLDRLDHCINFSFDTATNTTVINTLNGTSGACGATITGTTPLTSFNMYNWDAGELLSTKTAASRNIFTFLDVNKNGICDGCTSMTVGEATDFQTTKAAVLQKYLRTSSVAEATNVIDWVRGVNVAGYRTRTLNVVLDQYKLGDIIHSTPTVVGAPQENYSALYQDASYGNYFNTTMNRTTMVYIGANDGMLHAFNAATGDEAWAYIPYNVLPHLKWLTDNSYPHIDYVDLKVKISEINFGTTAVPKWRTVLIGGMRFGGGEISDTSYPIDGRKWRSSYFALDVTVPEAPVPLWEWNPGDNTLGFTMSYPAIVKIGDEFFAVVGTGPKAAYTPSYEGDSAQNAKLFVINVKTGTATPGSARLSIVSAAATAQNAASFQVSDAYSFFTDPIAVDINFVTTDPVVGGTGTSYNTDAVYIGESYWKPVAGVCPASCLPSCNVSGPSICGSWNSRMWRLVTNNDINPANWKMYNFYNNPVGQTITAAAGATMDSSKNLWIFYGTGKYLNGDDKSDTSRQAFYGIKDPCWGGATGAWKTTCVPPPASLPANPTWGAEYSVAAASYVPSVATANLVDVTGAVVGTVGAGVTDGSNTVTGVAGAATFAGLKTLVAGKSGWYMYFSTVASLERSLNKPSIVGGLVLFTTFVPATDPCALGGNSWFYATYYETGSAFSASVIGTGGGAVLRKSATSSVGMASSIAVHAGREAGAKAFVQLSTGEASVVDVTTPNPIKSGIIAWREL